MTFLRPLATKKTKAEKLRAGSTSRLLAAAALAGLGTMAIELSAVRLIAPWFGTSQAVWTSAIGAVLVALCAGYLVGGRWAHADAPEKRLSVCLWAAAAWAVLLPKIAPWIAALLVPEGASLEQVASALPLTSLACSLVLFFPPALLLATSGPLVVELIARGTSCPAGSAGGKVLACSTVGSLLGTFGTTYFAIPSLGVQGTLWVTAGLICLGAVFSSRAGAQHQAAGLVLGALLSGWIQPDAEPFELIAIGESPYQQVRVTELEDGWRALEVNEHRGSFQSLWAPEPGLLGPGYYYDYFSLPPAWSGASEDWDALVLGLGAGTAWRVLEGALPLGVELGATGVELDPLVIELAREHMGLPQSSEGRRVISGWDARVALGPLRQEGSRWDHVVVDVYANQVEIPAHLATVEFFTAAQGVLKPGGWLQVNVGALGVDDPLVLAMGATLADVFGGPTLALEVPFSRNVVLCQRHQASVLTPSDPGFADVGLELRALVQRAQVPGTWTLLDSGDGQVLTDLDAPMESLQRASLARLGGEL